MTETHALLNSATSATSLLQEEAHVSQSMFGLYITNLATVLYPVPTSTNKSLEGKENQTWTEAQTLHFKTWHEKHDYYINFQPLDLVKRTRARKTTDEVTKKLLQKDRR